MVWFLAALAVVNWTLPDCAGTGGPAGSAMPSMSIRRCEGPRRNGLGRYGGGSVTSRGFSQPGRTR